MIKEVFDMVGVYPDDSGCGAGGVIICVCVCVYICMYINIIIFHINMKSV